MPWRRTWTPVTEVDTRPGDPYRVVGPAVARSFAAAAARYDQHAVLQRLVAERLDERLALVRLSPQRILDLGAGTGYGAELLARRYRKARLLLLDLALPMLHRARGRHPAWLSRRRPLCADAAAIPLADEVVDLSFSSLTLQWCPDLDRVFAEVRRVMRPGGLFMFATFGPDTLREMRASWAEVDVAPHVHLFIDMHDVGDALIRCGWQGPVLDVERITLQYPDVMHLMRDLQGLGAQNRAAGRRRTLTGRRRLRDMIAAYERFRVGGQLPATFEVVYGHAWAPEQDARPQDGSTVAAFPATKLGRRKR